MIDYFDHPAISNTKLGWFKRSPAHFKYFQDHKQPDKEAYIFGNASHTILFEEEKFEKEFYVLDESKRPYPDKTFNEIENKKWKKDLLDAYSHKKIISLEEYEKIEQMMKVLHRNSFVKELLSGCVFEKEVFWTDPETGLECKKKVDGECSTHRIDYKTTDDADPTKWQKKAWSYDYYRQAGFYDLDIPKEFYFIVQEKTAPFEVSIHKAMPDLMNFGKNEAMHILGKIKAHKEANHWPGYEMKVFKPEATEREQNYFDFDIPAWKLQSM